MALLSPPSLPHLSLSLSLSGSVPSDWQRPVSSLSRSDCVPCLSPWKVLNFELHGATLEPLSNPPNSALSSAPSAATVTPIAPFCLLAGGCATGKGGRCRCPPAPAPAPAPAPSPVAAADDRGACCKLRLRQPRQDKARWLAGVLPWFFSLFFIGLVVVWFCSWFYLLYLPLFWPDLIILRLPRGRRHFLRAHSEAVTFIPLSLPLSPFPPFHLAFPRGISLALSIPLGFRRYIFSPIDDLPRFAFSQWLLSDFVVIRWKFSSARSLSLVFRLLSFDPCCYFSPASWSSRSPFVIDILLHLVSSLATPEE